MRQRLLETRRQRVSLSERSGKFSNSYLRLEVENLPNELGYLLKRFSTRVEMLPFFLHYMVKIENKQTKEL